MIISSARVGHDTEIEVEVREYPDVVAVSLTSPTGGRPIALKVNGQEVHL